MTTSSIHVSTRSQAAGFASRANLRASRVVLITELDRLPFGRTCKAINDVFGIYLLALDGRSDSYSERMEALPKALGNFKVPSTLGQVWRMLRDVEVGLVLAQPVVGEHDALIAARGILRREMHRAPHSLSEVVAQVAYLKAMGHEARHPWLADADEVAPVLRAMKAGMKRLRVAA